MTERSEPDIEISDRNLQLIENFVAEHFDKASWANLRILDSGCEKTGRQLEHLGKRFGATVVGLNLSNGFPWDTLHEPATNAFFTRMDGCSLGFRQDIFDLITSVNVIEHVPDPRSYIAAIYDALKPGGYAIIKWAPAWDGPFGHHVQPNMVRHMERRLDLSDPSGFELDGKLLPKWAHFTMSRDEVVEHLASVGIAPKLGEWIAFRMFDSDAINRIRWEVADRSIRSLNWTIENVELAQVRVPEDTLASIRKRTFQLSLRPDIAGASYVCRKPQPALQ